MQGGFVEEVAAAVGSGVVLQRVIRDVLLTFGKENAVDLGFCPLADELDMLIDLRQATADRGDRPLERGIAADDCLLMGEVPNAVPPILQAY